MMPIAEILASAKNMARMFLASAGIGVIVIGAGLGAWAFGSRGILLGVVGAIIGGFVGLMVCAWIVSVIEFFVREFWHLFRHSPKQKKTGDDTEENGVK